MQLPPPAAFSVASIELSDDTAVAVDPLLLARQIDLEDQSRDLALSRLRWETNKKTDGGNRSTTPAARLFLKHAVEPLGAHIAEALGPRRGAPLKAAKALAALHPTLQPVDMALIGLRALLDKTEPPRLTTLAARIGKAIEDEAAARVYREQDRKFFDQQRKKLAAKTVNDRHIRRVLRDLVRKRRDAADIWPHDISHRVGGFVLDRLMAAGLCKRHEKRDSRGYWAPFVRLTARAEALLREHEGTVELYRTFPLAMVHPPLPPTAYDKGGYWTDFPGLRFITASEPGCGYKKELDEQPGIRGVYRSVSRLQNVALRVNRPALEVVDLQALHNVPIGGIPETEPRRVPPRLDACENDEQARKARNKKAAAAHDFNAKRKVRHAAFERIRFHAHKFKTEAAIYFPKHCDFRGRVCDIPTGLHPQGSDLAKGLLEFAEGVPLGPAGMRNLAVHGANMFGMDKMSFADRVRWVEENERHILDSARNPHTCKFWESTDKSRQFLAFCFEWLGACTEGPDFVSHLPCAVDGSCNGFQHLSALMRDEHGGGAVNLVPGPAGAAPEDLYEQVGEGMRERLRAVPPSDPQNNLAGMCLPLIKRKVVKRAVMTLPYGSTPRGRVKQLVKALAEADECQFIDAWDAATYLEPHLMAAAREIVGPALRCMEWLRDVARVVAKAGLPIEWTAPSGFPVRQGYYRTKDREVEMALSGERVRLTLKEPTAKRDVYKAAAGIAPNFVHSLDAAHLLATVDLFHVAIPGASIVTVHDSFATHAAHLDTLDSCIRAAFVRQYDGRNLLQDFREQVAEKLPKKAREKLLPVPKLGELDISQVLRSEYFFA